MNSLDKPFKVGDRVKVSQHGQNTYGHDGKFLAGRKGVVNHIPQERWNNNCVAVKFDDETGSGHMAGCWAFDLDLNEETLTKEIANEEDLLATATNSGAEPWVLKSYRRRIGLLREALAAKE